MPPPPGSHLEAPPPQDQFVFTPPDPTAGLGPSARFTFTGLGRHLRQPGTYRLCCVVEEPEGLALLDPQQPLVHLIRVRGGSLRGGSPTCRPLGERLGRRTRGSQALRV
jgi:hypothetical protein